jgi:hypothetical protein
LVQKNLARGTEVNQSPPVFNSEAVQGGFLFEGVLGVREPSVEDSGELGWYDFTYEKFEGL